MKKALASLVIAALFVGTANAQEWRVYRVTERSSQYYSDSAVTNSSFHGSVTNIGRWNGADVTNFTYLTPVRGADGKPVVTFDKNKTTESDTSLLIVKVGADGKVIASSNSESVVSFPWYTYHSVNGSVIWTNPASTDVVERTFGWIDYKTVKATQFQPGVTNSKPAVKTIKVYKASMAEGSDQVVEAKGYQTIPGEDLAGKKPKSSFAKTAGYKRSTARIYDAHDNNTTSDIPYEVDFTYSEGYKYDSTMSKKLNAAAPANLAAALTTVKGLLGTKYYPVSYGAWVQTGFYVREDRKDSNGVPGDWWGIGTDSYIVVVDGVPYVAHQEPFDAGVWWKEVF